MKLSKHHFETKKNKYNSLEKKKKKLAIDHGDQLCSDIKIEKRCIKGMDFFFQTSENTYGAKIERNIEKKNTTTNTIPSVNLKT